MITISVMFRFFPWDVVEEYKKNLDEQYDFSKKLSKFIFDKTIVRLHHTSLVKDNIDSFGEREVLLDKFPTLKIDNGLTKLQTSLIKISYLFFLMTAQVFRVFIPDIPFIAFWPNKKETSY